MYTLAELIEEKPQNMTVFLSSPEEVDFRCVTPVTTDVALVLQYSNGSTVQNIVDGSIRFDQTIEADSNGRVWSVHVLTIAVKIVYNATIIHCQANAENTKFEAANAILLMQGTNADSVFVILTIVRLFFLRTSRSCV